MTHKMRLEIVVQVLLETVTNI